MSFIPWPFLPSITTQHLCSQAIIIFFLKTNNKTEIQVRSIVRIIIFPPKRSTELKQILQRSTLSLFGFCLFLLFLFANHLRKGFNYQHKYFISTPSRQHTPKRQAPDPPSNWTAV